MKQKFKILRVAYSYYPDIGLVAKGFRLEGVIGTVDPFVSGLFDNEPEFATPQMLNEWYTSQVGKTLHCDDLVKKAFATTGKTYIA